jgi:branched-chain amino acid transport system permease protein
VSLVVFRLRGAYFAIGSWVMSEVFALSASLIVALGGGSGLWRRAKLARYELAR